MLPYTVPGLQGGRHTACGERGRAGTGARAGLTGDGAHAAAEPLHVDGLFHAIFVTDLSCALCTLRDVCCITIYTYLCLGPITHPRSAGSEGKEARSESSDLPALLAEAPTPDRRSRSTSRAAGTPLLCPPCDRTATDQYPSSFPPFKCFTQPGQGGCRACRTNATA
jgi:hypothetical protein